MSLKQQAVKGVFWSFTEKWCNQIVSTSVFLVLARLLGPKAFGLIAMAGVFMAFMGPFLNQGFAQAIIQREEVEPEHLDTAFWISFITGLLLIVITVASAGLVANIFDEPQLTPILRWLSLNFLFTAFQSVPIAILRRRLAFRALAIRTSIATIFSGVAGLLMAFQGFGVWSLVGQQLAGGLFGVIALWHTSKWRPGIKVSRKHFQELFSFGINVMGILVIKFFNRRSDDLLIGYFLGSTALGYYSVAYRLLLVMVNLLTTTTTQVALPTFSKLQRDRKKLKQAFYTGTQLTSYFSFPAFVAVIILAPEIVPVFFGEQWEASIPVMQALSLVGIIKSIANFNDTIMMAMGKPDWSFKISLSNAILNVVIFFITVRWGILAVAIGFTISGYLFGPIYIYTTKQLININLKKYLHYFLAPTIGCLGMSIVAITLKNTLGEVLNSSLLLLSCILLGLPIYILLSYFVDREFSVRVIQLIKLALNKKSAIRS